MRSGMECVSICVITCHTILIAKHAHLMEKMSCWIIWKGCVQMRMNKTIGFVLMELVLIRVMKNQAGVLPHWPLSPVFAHQRLIRLKVITVIQTM